MSDDDLRAMTDEFKGPTENEDFYENLAEVEANCRGAQWGCIDCKKVLHANMVAELTPIRERASALMASPSMVADALDHGAAKARAVAQATMTETKEKMGLPLA